MLGWKSAWRLMAGFVVLSVVSLAPVDPALAAPVHLDGRQLGLVWGLPFAGLLLSIAIMPLLAPSVWHHHFGKITAAWALAFLVPCLMTFGPPVTMDATLHALLLEYIPFIILLLALFTVAGGVVVTGDIKATPSRNTALLALGTGLASVTGTTGAAMLLIRPLLRANAGRLRQVHVVVFFIFLVANIGGSLTPLGDPPLFLGYLKGVNFLWPARNLLAPMLICTGLLLTAFYVLDHYYFAKDGKATAATDPRPPRVTGLFNGCLLVMIVGVVLASGAYDAGPTIAILGVPVAYTGMLRDGTLLLITAMSWFFTTQAARTANAFSFAPIVEVGKLFIGIFITIVPVIAMLSAGKDGALASIVALVTGPDGQPINRMYFWMAGSLSAFLDNAPTYLVFFNLAGGNPVQLMGPLRDTLIAISAGAVFMGAMSYIGNAPNFMVKAVAEEQGVEMPSFLGYMAWSCTFLLPCFALVTVLFF
jgi:Na+/H+ antiporter NhaD/arsenite permease-like protein